MDVRALLEQIEQRSYEAEQRAREEEERAMRRAEEARRAATPPKRIGELMQQKISEAMPRGPSKRAATSWRLTPTTARKAVVYAEILGPCKAEQKDEDRWS